MAARPLEYLVLFSVVATDSQEEGEEGLIVQLAWEIISISKNQVLGKEQVYVCPGGGAPGRLPPGVMSEAIQSAGNLDSALKQFHSTLTKLGGCTFSLVTFGPTALRGLLHPQAYKICLSLQKYLHRYLDIIKEVTSVLPALSTPPSTVEAMAKLLGIPVVTEGAVKPGLEELAIVGQVAQKLISQGHVFQAQEFIRDDIKLEVTPDINQVKEGCVVRLRGLPFQASLKDVAGFLSGLNYIPGGIVFGINSVGRRTGEAIAALETPEQALLLLQRHRQYLNQRYVEVYEATPDDFIRMTGVKNGMGGGGGGASGVCVARLQGLPYRVTEGEIVDFFKQSVDVKFGKKGVMIVHYADGRATGDGFALFDNEQELTQALQLNKSMLGNRYVELFKSSLKEFEMVLCRSGSDEAQQQFCDLLGLTITPDPELEALRGNSKNCVKLRGIPYTATPEDVILFFKDLKEEIATQGIHMVLNAVNRPTGECYVQMKSVEAAHKASETLHKKYIENRYIEVFQCSGDEVAQGIQDQGTGGGAGRGYSSYRGDRGYRGGGKRFSGGERRRHGSGGSRNTVKVRGLPYSATEKELSSFFSDFEVKDSDVEIIYNSGRATGIAYVTFSHMNVAQQAIRQMDGKHLGNRYLELSLNY